MAQFTQSTDESKDILTNLVPLFSDVEMSITFGSLCKQLDKGQDLAVHGKYDKGYYVGVFDGHGGKLVSKFLKMNLPKYLLKKNNINIYDQKISLTSNFFGKLFDKMQNELIKYHPTAVKRCGSTALCGIMYKNSKIKSFQI
jgi:serine/threonine protein phosphatase PrpC